MYQVHTDVRLLFFKVQLAIFKDSLTLFLQNHIENMFRWVLGKTPMKVAFATPLGTSHNDQTPVLAKQLFAT